jgi:hypothetical protein
MRLVLLHSINKTLIYLLLPLLLLLVSITVKAEGTAQWMPTGMRAGQELSLVVFNTNDGNDRLGTVGCNVDERINIAVSSDFANERIYIGMNKFSGTASFFRVMSPTGVQVYPPTIGTLKAVLSNATGNTGEGYISSLTEARNGPIEVHGAGGYNAISITPSMAGNYYIEFNGNSSTTFNKPSKHQISYFDVTVAKTNGLPEGPGNHTAINGRLNSFQWALYNKTSGSGFNDVDATFYLYHSDDSLTISVDWDLVKAGGWDIAFTRRGVQNTGDYFVDRQSQPYSTVGKGSVNGNFPIFVSEPDSIIYQSAKEKPKLTFLEYDRCSGSTCFLYNISKGGQIEILLDLNENGVFDPGTSDRILVDSKPAGTHCLAWDDLDGLGDLVLVGQAQAIIKYQAGIFHMPLGDVEANPNGFNRTLIRPTFLLTGNQQGNMYYDHSVLGGAFSSTDYDYVGCSSNCNIWSPDDGNQVYINTWFSFVELQDTLIVTFKSCDRDGDGLTDNLDIDDDNDGIPDVVETYKGDHDNDGVPDYEDADFCNATFQGVNGWDCANGLPDPSGDLDGDGLRNVLDPDFPNCGSSLLGACSNYDADLDGIADCLDRDSDNDGISDLIELGGTDTDGDGEVDDLTDIDGDGLADDYDNDVTDGPSGSSPCVNQPSCLQGNSTNSLMDVNNDGVTDNEKDTDGDGLADWIDLDSDNDGIPDAIEIGGTDTDGDGWTDNYVDIDRDGFNDKSDGNICKDSTSIGTSTYVPASSTGVDFGTEANGQPNGILSVAELYSDGDEIVLDFGVNLPVGTRYVLHWKRKNYGNGVTTFIGVDESVSAGSGYSTNSVSPSTNSEDEIVATLLEVELSNTRYVKLRVLAGGDNDFEVDAMKYFYKEENCVAGTPLIVTGPDANNDGIPDSYPANDTDGDGVLNHLDLDSDNDGIPDVVEAGGTDENGDGRADDFVDSDNDGLNDILDGDVGNNAFPENSANALILTGLDTDNDAKPNTFPNGDFDGDGVYNYLDLDADDDGILDVVEAGGNDANRDGQEDGYVDIDNDGFNDLVDGDPTNVLGIGVDTPGANSAGATTKTGADGDNDGAPDSYPEDNFDGDGHLNYLDIDADNDGITDNTEGQSTAGYLAPTNVDSDGDGIDNRYDNNDGLFGGAGSGIIPSDIDNSENPDYLDLDTDNDGVLDAIEGHDSNIDGIADGGSPANTGLPGGTTDIDGDGLLDGYDNNTSSVDPTNNNLQGTSHPNFSNIGSTERDWRELPDADNDGISDFIDIDDDNDGVLDKDEAPCDDPAIRFLSTPEAYWSLDNNTNDVSGNAHNERSDGNTPGFSTDAIQGSHSANFNGTSNQIRYSQDGAFMEDIYSDVSFSAWIKTTNVSGDRVIYEEGGGTNGLILWLDNGVLTYTARSGGAGSETSVAVNTSLSIDNLWHHVAATFEDGVMTVYLDGIPSTVTAGYVSIPGHGSDGGIGGPHGGSPNGVNGNFAGLMDAVRYSNSEAWTAARIGYEAQRFCDSDADGIADHLDLDSDNDGIPDIIEAGGTDGNNDGRADDDTDSDNDGWSNIFDNIGPGQVGTPLTDEDKDGDGLPNRIDLDADNDGIADIIEAGGVDANNDGQQDGVDADFNGWSDIVDGNNGGTALPLVDSDGDGNENYLDIDSDNDGITDNIEAQTTAAFLAPTGSDTDNDGWDNRYDSDNGGTAITLSNHESVGNPDYTDLDTDGDGQPDWIEGFDDDKAGVANDGDALNDFLARATDFSGAGGNATFYNNSLDGDTDGIPNWLEDSDLDGQPNFLDPDSPFYHDSNNDGLIDLFDPNSFGAPSLLPNKDGDLEPDWRDTDNATTLPITLISFEAEKKIESVLLIWETLAEINNDFFTIEKSKDGEYFEFVGTVKGAGNSLEKLRYELIDPTPFSGVTYYRLKQTDFNGEHTYSELRAVDYGNDNSKKIVVFPNPTNGQELFLSENSRSEYTLVSLTTADGKKIFRKKIDNQFNTIKKLELLNGVQLNSGVYFLKVTYSDHSSKTKKVIVK